MLSIWGFVSPIVSVTTTQCCLCSVNSALQTVTLPDLQERTTGDQLWEVALCRGLGTAEGQRPGVWFPWWKPAGRQSPERVGAAGSQRDCAFWTHGWGRLPSDVLTPHGLPITTTDSLSQQELSLPPAKSFQCLLLRD